MEVEDIYFLMAFSRHGETISLTSPQGGDVITQELIECHYFPGTQMYGKKISIKEVMDLPLRIVLFTMQRLSRSQGAHQDSQSHMLYALEAMAPTVFN